MLQKRVPEDGEIVDLGCGAGLPVTAALAETHNVTGVDFSKRQIALARKNVPHATFVQADMSEVSFPEGSIDGVTAFFSIIHVHRDLHARLFESIANWLKPGGVLVAALGKRGASEQWEDNWLGARMFWSFHDPEMAQEQITEAGMHVEQARFETVHDGVDGSETFFWVVATKS
jgi:SAM-dependent methyltransferase